MKKFANILSSYRTKVTILLVLAFFFLLALSNSLIYKYSLDAQFNQLRDKLTIIAQTAALMVDSDTLLSVPLNKEGLYSPQYKVIAEKLRKIKDTNPMIRYIYTMSKTDQKGVLQFIVDPEPLTQLGKRQVVTSYPGEKYDTSNFPEMLKGFQAPSADKKLGSDEWGMVLSGYAPIKDKTGKAVAILGVDITAQDVYLTEKEVKRRILLVLLLGVFISIILGLSLSKRITRRINKLVEGTRHIAAQDLDYKVDVKGHDEISELAASFNQMASSLSASKKKLQDYFFRVVQSLVKILEAKDAYTMGHSERVANYAKAIALEMGFSEDKAEMVRKAGELHDIGKLVIDEGIINKKDKLNDAEWKVVREHPVVAEEVLKPVLIDEELLAMVRGHHERYDGTGYPDRLKGDNINIFAQIICVADSFDAMTSPRSYRAALSEEVAIEELKKNSGTQFNTQIVKAFLKTLHKE